MVEEADLTPVTTPREQCVDDAECQSANIATKRKETPHPAVGVLLNDIEECHVSYPSSELLDMPNLEALNMLGDVCNREAE